MIQEIQRGFDYYGLNETGIAESVKNDFKKIAVGSIRTEYVRNQGLHMWNHKKKYMLSVDQSTQGTKALLFDNDGKLLKRKDVSHAQIVNDKGWVEHDLDEIWENTKKAVESLLSEQNVKSEEIAGIGISNQRETIAVWNRKTGHPVYHAIVWQCARGEKICNDLKKRGAAVSVKRKDRIGSFTLFFGM